MKTSFEDGSVNSILSHLSNRNVDECAGMNKSMTNCPFYYHFHFFGTPQGNILVPILITLVHYYELVACINSFMTATRAKLTKCYRPLKQSSPHFPNGHLKTVSHLTMAKLKYIIFSPSRRKFLNAKSYLLRSEG